MITCDQAREQIAAGETNEALSLHLSECLLCSAAQRRNHALDHVLRDELVIFAPAALTERLLALADNPEALAPRVSPWHLKVITGLTVIAIVVSSVLFWQIGGAIAGQLGLSEMLRWFAAQPGVWMNQVLAAFPQSAYALDAMTRIRDIATWLLCAAVLWIGAERWRSRRTALA